MTEAGIVVEGRRVPRVTFDTYRVGGGLRPGQHWAHRWHVDPWFRAWQCEWEPGACMWCPRAWTRAGVRRRAWRWFRRGTDIRRHEKRYGPNPQAWALRAEALLAMSFDR